MTYEEFRAYPALSFSGMKDLAISPLRYWHLHLNPDREPEEPTKAQKIGTAIHAAVLQPEMFRQQYAPEFVPPDECLRTIEEMRSFLNTVGKPPKGTRKAEIISQVQAYSMDVPIYDVLAAEYEQANADKTLFGAEDWKRICDSAVAVRNEPVVQELLESGRPEEPIALSLKRGDYTVPLKALVDWNISSLPSCILDIKSFTTSRGKTIDKSIADAIYYEGYNLQAYLYTLINSANDGNNPKNEFILVFVESEPPHEVRIKVLRPKTGGQPNLYWERARVDANALMDLYLECRDKYGDAPWREPQRADPLLDEEIAALAY